MAIEKRGNSWRIGVKKKDSSGKFVWFRRTVPVPPSLSDEEARIYCKGLLEDFKREVEAGAILDPAMDYTVRDFFSVWDAKHLQINVEPTTRFNYKYLMQSRVFPSLGEHKLRSLTPAVLASWVAEISLSPRRTTRLPEDQLKEKRRPSAIARMASDEKLNKPLSKRTVQHYYDVLDDMLDKAVQWGCLESNPLKKVDRPKPKKSRAKSLSEEQALFVLDRLADEEPSFRFAVLLAITCSLRLGETCELKLSDVDFSSGTISVTRALKYTPDTGPYVSGPKTESSIRDIRIPDTLVQLLKEEKISQDVAAAIVSPDVWHNDGYIVHAWNGKQVAHDTPSKQWRKFADRIGLAGITYHMLRHTCASILLANNIDIVAVACRLGHSDPSTTLRIYSHMLQRRDSDAADVFDKLATGQLIQEARKEEKPVEASKRLEDLDADLKRIGLKLDDFLD